MKVKIGNTIHDGEKEPIMLILSKGERKQIAHMAPEATKYCIYPDIEKWTKNDEEAIKKWMEIPLKDGKK